MLGEKRMKIKCISIGSSSMLTVGKIYLVVKNTDHSFYLKNDHGVLCPYLKENFEEVEG